MLSKNKFKVFVLCFLITLLLFITPNHSALGKSPRIKVGDIIIPPSTKLGDPAYDSGWEDLGVSPDPIAIVFDHHLGGDPEDYLVDLSCKDTFLGVYNCTDNGFVTNAHWYGLTNEEVSVFAETFIADAVRVRIYKAEPAYDSDWQENTQGLLPEDIDIKHNLEGDPRSYLVDLECQDDSALGIYDCVDDNFDANAEWHGLTRKGYCPGFSISS